MMEVPKKPPPVPPKKSHDLEVPDKILPIPPKDNHGNSQSKVNPPLPKKTIAPSSNPPNHYDHGQLEEKKLPGLFLYFYLV